MKSQGRSIRFDTRATLGDNSAEFHSTLELVVVALDVWNEISMFEFETKLYVCNELENLKLVLNFGVVVVFQKHDDAVGLLIAF